MPITDDCVTDSKFLTKTRFRLLAAISIAFVLLLGFSRFPEGSLPSLPAFSQERSLRPDVEESPRESGTIPASAFVVPTWKRPSGKDFWPGVRQPPTLSSSNTDLEDDGEVIGVQVEGQARAYCIAAFRGAPGDKVVNDVLAGRPVTVAYCEFTRCARVFTTENGSAPLHIGIGGWDAEKGLMLHLESVNYALVDGKNLTQPQGQPLPYRQSEHERTTWGQWRQGHPHTDVYVLSPTQQSVREKGYWSGIRQPPILTAEQAELGEDDEVIGVCINGRARAYCVDSLSGSPEFHVVNDMLAGRPVTVAYCDLMRCSRVFTATTGSEPFDINVGGLNNDEGMLLHFDGVKYSLKDGKNVTHPGGPLLPFQKMEHVRMTWGQWRRTHPDTDVYRISPPS